MPTEQTSAGKSGTFYRRLAPEVKNAYVIPSAGCTDATDHLHFNANGYKQLGKRYAEKMLSLIK
ncbi:MAG: sialate O-acetylesterase [Ferruginibacter sp.]